MRCNTVGVEWLQSSEKRNLDLVCTAALLPLAAPVGGLSLLASQITNPGKPFFTHARVGLDGKQFNLSKIRTMPFDTPNTTSDGPAALNTTGIGRRLRPFGIDELPQLYNILHGDMSLVGPRALAPHDIELMGSALSRNEFDEWEEAYFSARPGGLSEFGYLDRGLDKCKEERFALKAKLDIKYVREASLKKDLTILSQLGSAGFKIAVRQFQ